VISTWDYSSQQTGERRGRQGSEPASTPPGAYEQSNGIDVGAVSVGELVGNVTKGAPRNNHSV
jgi:hypothetical protein